MIAQFVAEIFQMLFGQAAFEKAREYMPGEAWPWK